MPEKMDDHDLLVRIDARTEALHTSVNKIESAVAQKADDERVTRLEQRMDKTDERNAVQNADRDKQKAEADKKLNYVVGGFMAIEALCKLVWH